MKQIFFIGLFMLVLINFNQAQVPYLSIEEAIELALENNYNIQVARNNQLISENNTSKFNTGLLPTVSGNASSTYNYSRQVVKIDGEKNSARGHDFPFTAGVTLNYVLFDKSRKYTIEQFDQLNNLSDVQYRSSVESMLANLIVAYFQVTTLERNIDVQRANLAVSKRILTRAEYAFEYGVATQLGILNSEVNVNNDSIQVQNSIVNFENAKRNLNIIIGRNPTENFRTDTTINYINDLQLEQVLEEALSNNVQILAADQNITLDQIAIDAAKTGWWPTINATGTYQWNQDFLVGPPANIMLQNIPGSINYIGGDGFNGGLNLSWNIFDGGRTKTQIQNAQISIENTKLMREDLDRQINRDVQNNWMSYQNALLIIATQQKNIETSQRNFDRTVEQFKIGNVSTTTYREAQTNLLNTQLSYLNSIYNAKVLETILLQLSGNLIEN